MHNQNALKQAVAEAAIAYVKPGMFVGVGTGSTANYFIDALARIKGQIEGTVASSVASAERLKKQGISVVELSAAPQLDIYVDGADEANHQLELIKGGGGALTREKIVLANATQFICIADASKLVDTLGAFPLPIEVIPMARSYVARQIITLTKGLGEPVWRQDFITDNGNQILDVHGLSIDDAKGLETALNQIVGVVTNGLFAHRSADVLLLGTQEGVRTLTV